MEYITIDPQENGNFNFKEWVPFAVTANNPLKWVVRFMYWAEKSIYCFLNSHCVHK